MQGDGQLDHAEAGAEMTAGLADGIQQVLAQLVGQGFQVRLAQPAQFGRRRGAVEQGRGGALAGISWSVLGIRLSLCNPERPAVYLMHRPRPSKGAPTFAGDFRRPVGQLRRSTM
jgi:hypothetical protein